MKKYNIFTPISCWYVAGLLCSSVRLMNGQQSLHDSQYKAVCLKFYRLWLPKHWKIPIAYRQWHSNFPRKVRKPNTERKTKSYIFSGFGNGISCSWEQKWQLEDLPLANFGCVSERFLLSVRTKSITKNFVSWKLCLWFVFVVFQLIFYIEP